MYDDGCQADGPGEDVPLLPGVDAPLLRSEDGRIARGAELVDVLREDSGLGLPREEDVWLSFVDMGVNIPTHCELWALCISLG